MEATVKLNQIEGHEYFCIYEVHAVKRNHDVITYDRYLNEKDAKEDVAFIHSHLRSLYVCAFIREQWVWC